MGRVADRLLCKAGLGKQRVVSRTLTHLGSICGGLSAPPERCVSDDWALPAGVDDPGREPSGQGVQDGAIQVVLERTGVVEHRCWGGTYSGTGLGHTPKDFLEQLTSQLRPEDGCEVAGQGVLGRGIACAEGHGTLAVPGTEGSAVWL